MFSAPDHATAQRMRTARAFVCTTLTLTDLAEKPVWGYAGRTLSGAVTSAQGTGWLRVVAERLDTAHGKLWDGPKTAQQLLPPEIPRPVLHHVHDWEAADWAYRAELYQHTDATVVSRTPVLEHGPALPDAWWAQLRTALDSLAEAPTERIAVREEYIRRAVPRYTGRDVDEIEWCTAHGDFHWSNLGGPDLTILDWEGLGPSPGRLRRRPALSLLSPRPRHGSTSAGDSHTHPRHTGRTRGSTDRLRPGDPGRRPHAVLPRADGSGEGVPGRDIQKADIKCLTPRPSAHDRTA